MTQSEIRSLSRQADRAAARVSSRPAWQQELASRAAIESGTDSEPRVNVVVVREVKRALASEGGSEEDETS